MNPVVIIIDTYRCNGCGSCVEICPEIFQLDETTEKAIIITDGFEMSDAIQEAIAYCPENCIEVS